jgi:isoleucyl-tRNA synthetase
MLDLKYEKEILKFWKEKKIYEKSRKKNAKGKAFYMMDGPPYATGHIHTGTALNKILKDVAMRSHRLQGFYVFDRPGYDTHGLPIEFQIEKQIGSKSKKDIEKFGVKRFVQKCKEFAVKFIDVMNSEFENLGVWMDWQNPYLTLQPEYIEAIWDAFKAAENKKLLYLGKYPVHICPRCETAVAYNEIDYRELEDISVFVKFPLKNKKAHLIIWSTTPWTLPGNTGVMVHPDFVYSEIQVAGERWIIAKELVPKIMSGLGLGYKIKKEYKGREMEGWQYENPLAKNLEVNPKKSYRVVLSGRYVNLEEGTGLVHTAPGHGKEDYEVGKEYGLDVLSPVDINGLLTKEAGKYAGKKARVVDEEIIKDLEKDGFLIKKVKYKHDYPFCWRCKSALLMISQPQWFLKISSIQKKLLKENQKTKWVPSWMKARMKAWLGGIGDWPISRKRYWGTPLPIWVCEKCKERKVVGSVKELEKLSGKKVREIHKPEIDSIELNCECGGKMRRIEDVLDVWFDSGVSSWAALGYPGKNQEFKRVWPADLNLEGKDQVRGWWNSQLILSEIRFEKKPFENIVVHGMVLDVGKRKMSKSAGNITSPQEIINKYGRDYLRYYLSKISKGEDFAFDESEFSEIGKVLRILVNVNNFVSQLDRKKAKLKVEDKWILSRLNSLTENVTEAYNNYKFPGIAQEIENFLVSDLSRTYIQFIRERSEETYEVLNKIRISLLKLLAPICPFITEKIWQKLRKEKLVKEESVHLTSWPKFDRKEINEKLEEEFETVKKIIEAGLAARDKVKIGLKWPLAKVEINYGKILGKELQEIIAKQLNIKKIKMERGKLKVKLDTKLTPKLEAEGYARVISRRVQEERKKVGLVKEEKIKLMIIVDKGLLKMLEAQKEFIKERVNAKKLILALRGKERFKNYISFKIKEKEVDVTFDKV